ncbi:hypothetical protein [uncultured Alistipes sp.]|uniref:hypothetical protein n=1 Tax=uncultured Alistipes sp. TaxID=538949 RepID=UPI00262C487B|nr:hypothetical protein [uncultured Alistipes sp.]
MNNTQSALIDASINGLAQSIGLIHPIAGIAGSAMAPILSNAVEMILPKTLSRREEDRIQKVFKDIVSKINKYLEDGKTFRNDEAYYNPTDTDIPNAQEILEGVLLKVREEYQSKKLVLYRNFFANLCFDETISFEHANFLLHMISKLSYRQFAILAYISDGHSVPTAGWDASFKSRQTQELLRYFDFYSEYIDLYNARLIIQSTAIPGFALGMSDTNISSLGISVTNLLELNNIIPGEDKENVGKHFDAICALLNKN